MTSIRWGIIGAGRIAHQFARDIAFAPSASLAAVASRKLASAELFAQEHAIPLAFGSYEALFNSDEVDAVYIATPHSHHFDQAKAAISAGKAVMCEKPLTLNPKESAALIDHAKAHETYLMEAMWTWFLPAIRQAKAWIDAGRIGQLVQLKADFGYPVPYDPKRREWDVTLGGGCLLEMGIYPVALNRLFIREEPVSTSVAVRLADNGAEADLAVLNTYAGTISTLATSFLSRQRNGAYLIGTDGYIVIPDFFRASEAELYRLDERLEHFVDDRQGGGFEFEIEAASQDIIAGRTQSEIMSWSDSQSFQDDMARIRRQF